MRRLETVGLHQHRFRDQLGDSAIFDVHDDDVLDDIAQAVISRGGEVLLLEPERLSNGTKVAAVLRW